MRYLRFFSLFLTLCLATLIAHGAEDESVRLNRIKQNNKTLKRFVLDNGITCLIREDNSAPAVSLQVWIGTGSIHEGEHLGYGMSHAVEHMIFKGTEKREPGQIAREIADAGGKINAYTSFDRTVFLTDLPSRNWEKGLDAIADSLMNASFPEEEWKKEKKVILREIAMGQDDPGRVMNKLLWRTAYRKHPYKYPVIGYSELFSRLTRNELLDFFKDNYVSGNAIFVAVGDFNASEMEKKIRETLGSWKHKVLTPRYVPAEPVQLGPRKALQTGSYEKSRLRWAYHTVELNHPDAVALDVLAQIVGQGRSSRLNESIKEDRQLVHNISAWSYTPEDPGLFTISASFDPENEENVLKALEEEVNSWPQARFSKQEITKARNTSMRRELSELETMKGQASSYASGEFYAANPRFSEMYIERLNSITHKDLRRVAGKYLDKDNRTVAILAPKTDTDSIKTEKVARGYRKPEIFTMQNGMRLIFREDNSLPFVYCCLAVKGGLLAEANSNNGITKLMSDLLTRGTSRQDSKEIAAMIESKGASLSAFSGRNSFGLQGKWFTDDSKPMFQLLADCLLRPAFLPEQISKQKKLQIATIEKLQERPFAVAKNELHKMIYKGHPYQWSTLGSAENLHKINQKDLHKHRDRLVTTKNMTLAVFGDISKDQTKKLVEKYFSNIPNKAAPTLKTPDPAPKLPSEKIRREPKKQAIILMGIPSVSLHDPEVEALTLIQKCLNGMSSELFRKVREELGLAYYVGAFPQIGLNAGALIFYAGTQSEKVDEVKKIFFEEIDRITNAGLSEKEISRSRNRIIASHEMGLQNNMHIAQQCAVNELLGLGFLHAFTTKERYRAITSQQIRDTARSILDKDKTVMSIVLPKE